MPFRPLTKPFIPCYVCAAVAPHRCRNCRAPVCEEHLHEKRCRACEKRLLEMAIRQQDSACDDAQGLVMAIGLAGCLSLPALLSSPFWLLYVLGFVVGMFAIPAILLRGTSARERFRAMADFRLPATPLLSTRARLPSASPPADKAA